MKILQPADWPQPKGYSNGIAARGQLIFVAGQIGWDTTGTIVSDDLAAQVRQTLLNTVAVLAAADAQPNHITRMTWYITDKREYLTALPAIGRAYREVIGPHYPAMAMVEVNALMEDRAKVEIETTAVLPDSD